MPTNETLDYLVGLVEKLATDLAAANKKLDAIQQTVDSLPAHLFRIENQTRTP